MRIGLVSLGLLLTKAAICDPLNSRFDPMTDNGLFGSAWAFQKILEDAGYEPIGADPLSTMSIYQALVSGADGAKPMSSPTRGTMIIISPTNENGAGCVGFLRGDTVWSNSGKTGSFGPTFTLEHWIARFGVRFGYYFFVLPEPRLAASASD